jgi:hydrogenase maturation factor
MPDGEPLPVGKLKMEALEALLAGLGGGDPSVLEGPGIGHDVAVLDHGGPMLLVAKTDPITFATDEIGFYAVAVSSNDIATCGGRPRWMLVTALLPAGLADDALARDIFAQLTSACTVLGVSLVGGHTEVTSGIDRPILVATMLGEVARDRRVSPSGARPGDAILLTKAIAVEGTSLLARELRADLLAQGFEADFLDRCAAMLHDPGISVLREAEAAMASGGVHAMHDPTEGGVATALWELAVASSARIVADPAAVPILPECRRLCDEFALNPFGLIASGSLLIACAPDAAEAIRAAVSAQGIACTPIGIVTACDGAEVVDPSGAPWPRFDQDELTQVL